MSRSAVRQQTALLRANVDDIAESIVHTETREPVGRARLVVLVGLPASGKSHFAALLAERVGGIVVSTDALRRRLFIAPSYIREESRTVFALARAVARRLLARGHVAIVDATNLRESDRAPLYALAHQAETPLIVVRVVASEDAIRERLSLRAARSSPTDASDADLAVYRMMRDRYQEPTVPFLTVDSAADLERGLARVEEAIRSA
jgi:predicted kinase